MQANIMYEGSKIVAFTGHRPDKLGGYGAEARSKLSNFAVDILKADRPGHLIVGGALGWDTAGALAAYRIGLDYVLAVPFEGQEVMWPLSSQIMYRTIKARAREVKVTCSPGFAAWKMQVRNRWMVDQADEVWALWNGSHGGTYNCVEYANLRRKPLRNLWSEWAVYQ